MKTNLIRRATSLLLCVALLITYIPLTILSAEDTAISRIADDPTIDHWKKLFGPDVLSTENAGGVWMDKSVFTDASAFNGTGIAMKDANSFLVALSAIAANKTVSGMSSTPTDTILVLDVSGSMNRSYNDVAEDLVDAANQSISTLLATNEHNRVGVVLYSGSSSSDNNSDAAILMLPLDRYTTGTDNIYLTYSNNYSGETIGVDRDVRVSGTNQAPARQNKTVVGATYIQNGVILAKDQFVADSNSTTVTDPVQGTLKRKPVVVLMSDGDPTLGSTNFTAPGQYDLGNGQSTSAALGFVSQLSISYAKELIKAKYNTECLFYTIGLGLGEDNSVAKSVLQPSSSTNAINAFWTSYNNASVGGTVTVQGGWNAKRVTKISTPLSKDYVDKSIIVTSSTTDLAGELKNAFQSIVETIQLQSKYYPTLISENEDLSGYISFVDRVGKYMEVTDVKGVLINNTLFSGKDLAQNFKVGANGGALGTASDPTALGHEMVAAVQARIGLKDADAARTLITLAHQYGQLSYISDTEFSNYIGWYANADGEFLGFWHEGITTMPDPDDEALTDATRPAYIIRSYGYLGAVDEEHGVSASDMMYATVQVRKSIQTGEEIVTFAVPAALIPVVTYNVSLNADNDLSDLEVTGAEHPIALVYEVALDDSINEFTVMDIVSDQYLADHGNDDGTVSFFSNKYDHNNLTGYGTTNTYAYFNPSRQNDKYYYLEDTAVYSDTNGTLYSGTSQPTGDKYYAYTVYKKDGSSLKTETAYKKISPEVLSSTLQYENSSSWYIPKGDVRVNLEGYSIYKGGSSSYDPAANKTGTLNFANIPFVDTHNHSVNDSGYNFFVGATLGNNGRLTVTPETGIKITKSLADGATSTSSPFTFTISNLTNENDSSTYPAYIILADGTASKTEVTFESGKATVLLNPLDVIYIGGMEDGTQFRIDEPETVDYKVDSVNGQSGRSYAEITVTANMLKEVSFVNANRGTGNVLISKEVLHNFGVSYQIPESKIFEMTVALSGVGTSNAEFPAKHTNGSVDKITTDAEGKFTVSLRHDEQIEISDLPAGTVVTVRELNPGAGFTPDYMDTDSVNDGVLTVLTDSTAAVIVRNSYAASEVYPVNVDVSGTKTLRGRDWLSTDSFTFTLQRLESDGAWTTLAEAHVKGTDASKNFSFNGAFANESFTAQGTYYYRVTEAEPTSGTIGGVSYDKTVHAFSVDVTDVDMDGKLEISAVRAAREETTHIESENNSWHVSVDFLNTYSATGNATVTIDLNKTVSNNSLSPLASVSGFEFELLNAHDRTVFAISEKTTDRGFTRLILNYNESDIGTHEYILRERIPTSVPAGWTYSISEIPVTVIVKDTNDGEITAVIFKGDPNSVPEAVTTSISESFINSYTAKPTSLPIDFVNKNLKGRDMNEGEFEFAILDVQGNTILTGKNSADGKVTFNDKLYFDKVGTYAYSILETTGDGNGIVSDKTVYSMLVYVTDEGGELRASYSILNSVGTTVVFNNTYTAKEVSHSVSGKKQLIGRVLLNEEFTFVLTEALDANGALKGNAISYEAKNFTDGTFSFPAITYKEAGTYYYVVTEKENGLTQYGIRYDKTEYSVTVTVKDNKEGALVIDEVVYSVIGGNDVNEIKFINNYIPNSTSVSIPGNKILEGKVLGEGNFSFELYKSNEAWELIGEPETVKNGANGSFSFASVEYDAVGTYYYVVKEVNGGEKIDGVTYDATEFRVKITVSDNLMGQLGHSIIVYDNYDVPQEGIEFVNVYEITGDSTVEINGSKTLNGRDMTDGEFTFELYETDQSFTFPEDPMTTATNTNGKFSFTLGYTAEDVGKTFYYTVREKNFGKTINGVKFSSVTYYITVKVLDGGKGNVTTEMTITNGESTVSSLDFVNEYSAIGTSIDFDGKKTLTGNRELKENDFTFDIYATGSSFAINGDPIKSVKNASDGTFKFEGIELDEAKTYYFVIKENATSPIGGVKYDSSVYNVTVTVKDDGNGKLYVESTTVVKIKDSVSEKATEIEFTNEYSASSVNLVLSGKKILSGRELLAGEFSFILQASDANGKALDGSVAIKAQNKADGSFTFDAQTFTEAKTYYFTLREDTSVSADRVKFDSTVYLVSVEVTDNGEGTLIASAPVISKLGEEDKVNEIVFANVYTPRPTDITVDVNVVKTVKNLGSASITPEGFEFILEDLATKLKSSVKTDASGKAVFTLTFSESDIGKTYTYKLTELNDGRENVKYSTAEYTVSVSISLDENNTLVASVRLNEADVRSAVAEFENIYDVPPVNPPTGDRSHLWLWIALAFISGTVIISAFGGKRREAR